MSSELIDRIRTEEKIKQAISEFLEAIGKSDFLELFNSYTLELSNYLTPEYLPHCKLDITEKSLVNSTAILEQYQRVRNRVSYILIDLLNKKSIIHRMYGPIERDLLLRPEIATLKNQQLQSAAVEGVITEISDIWEKVNRLIKISEYVIENVKSAEYNIRLQQDSIKSVLYYLRGQ